MKNALIVPTLTDLCVNSAKLQKVVALVRYPTTQYWKSVIPVCVLNGIIPSKKSLERWIATDYFPYEYTRGTAIRRLLASMNLPHDVRFSSPEGTFPFSKYLTKLTERQRSWLMKNSNFKTLIHSEENSK